MTASVVNVGHGANKPRRPPSHAKKHFSKYNSRWICNYCEMSYGCNTATSNFWKHLSSKHPNKLCKSDERQQSSSMQLRHSARRTLRRCNRDQLALAPLTSGSEMTPFNRHQDIAYSTSSVTTEQTSYRFQEHIHLESHQSNHLMPEESESFATSMSETATAAYHFPTAKMAATTNMPATSSPPALIKQLPSEQQQLRFREIGMEQIVFDVIRNNPRFAEMFHNSQIQALFQRATPTFCVSNIDEIEREILRIQRDKMAAGLSRHTGGYYLYVEPVYLLQGQRQHLVVLLAQEKFDYSVEREFGFSPMVAPTPHTSSVTCVSECCGSGADEMESLFQYKRNTCHLLAMIDVSSGTSKLIMDCVENVATALEEFKVAGKLLGIVVGKFEGCGDFANSLHNRLRKYGAYSCKTYATRESIKADLELNLQDFRQHSEKIKEELLKCIQYLDQIEHVRETLTMTNSNPNNLVTDDESYFLDWQHITQQSQAPVEAIKFATTPERRSEHPVPLPATLSAANSFKKLSWDLMPILPHANHIRRYLIESRALGLDYNYNCGTQWRQLKLTVKELARLLRRSLVEVSAGRPELSCETHARCQVVQRADKATDGGGDAFSFSRRLELLHKLSKKVDAFAASCTAALNFLSVTKLTSPFTRKIVKALEKMPKGLPENTQKNILFLKMWTKFKFNESEI